MNRLRNGPKQWKKKFDRYNLTKSLTAKQLDRFSNKRISEDLMEVESSNASKVIVPQEI